MLAAIETNLNRILDARGEGHIEIRGDLMLLGGGVDIDSLDLAEIVMELQALTGRDPFQGGFIEFRTVDELASLFSV